MKIPEYICLIFLLALTVCGNTQTDSLENLLNTDIPDTTRIDVLGELSQAHFASDPDQAIAYALEAVRLSDALADAHRLGQANKNVGLAHYYKGDFVEVLQYWEASLDAFRSIQDDKGTANLLSNIGAVYFTRGDNTKAIEYYLEAQRIAERAGLDLRLATVLQNIGAVYESTAEYDKAESYLTQALEICKAIDYEKGIAMTSLNLGEVYFKQENFELAEFYFNNAREVFEKLGDNFLPNALNMIGRLKTRQGDFTEARQVLRKAYDMAVAMESKLAMVDARNAEGDLFLALGSPGNARQSFNEAMELAISIGANEDLRDAYIGLIESYKASGDFANTVRFQDSLLAINQLIYDLEKTKQLEGLQLTFVVENKEKEIQLLSADNEIKSQQIARANLLRNFLLVVAILLLLIAAGIAYQYRYMRKTNKIITEEKDKSNKLLLNILPEETAEELKANGYVKARKYRDATVLFTDFVDFTGQARDVPPEELVKSINYFFTAFDAIIDKYNLEKIKTIGDAYMCAGGIPQENENNTRDALMAAMEIVNFVEETAQNPPEGITPFKIRVGVNSGPLVAGVVGSSKFQYDVWGDTVNIAARMETASMANQINVSHNVFEKLKNDMTFDYRGEIDVKNRGKLKMYFLDRAKSN